MVGLSDPRQIIGQPEFWAPQIHEGEPDSEQPPLDHRSLEAICSHTQTYRRDSEAPKISGGKLMLLRANLSANLGRKPVDLS